jgi:hypothetical protein
VVNPLTGEVVVMKFARTPSSRDLGKIGRKLGRKTLEDLWRPAPRPRSKSWPDVSPTAKKEARHDMPPVSRPSPAPWP